MTMFPQQIDALARQVLDAARKSGLRIATAESCTGGLVAAALCAVPGASDVFERGFVTYSNTAKMEMLGVPATTLDGFGAVSEPTARAMARGVLAHSKADLAVSTTGIAGPGGGGPDKPVGTVHLAVARRDGAVHSRHETFGDPGREAIQLASVVSALTMLLDALA
jgi:nicotinamide-nucleotide amidase